MAFEDVHYLKQNSTVETQLLFVDSEQYENPSDYTVDINNVLNVIGVDIIESGIPKTDFTIDENRDTISIDSQKYTIPHANYTLDDLSIKLTEILAETGIYCIVENSKLCLNKPGEPFTLNVKETTCSLALGLGTANNNDFYSSESDTIFESIIHSAVVDESEGTLTIPASLYGYFHKMNVINGTFTEILGDGSENNYEIDKYGYIQGNVLVTKGEYMIKGYAIVNFQELEVTMRETVHSLHAPNLPQLFGERYIIFVCSDVQKVVQHENNNHIEHITFNGFGYNKAKYDNKFVHNFLHPLNMSQLRIRFVTSKGEAYNFKGLNHTMKIGIRYLRPDVSFFEDKKEFTKPYADFDNNTIEPYDLFNNS